MPRWEGRTWGAIGAAWVAVVLLLAAGLRGLLVEPLPAAEEREMDRAAATAAPRTAAVGQEVAMVLRADPFHPERHAPATRFRFPGEGTATGPAVSVAALKLIGVALIEEGRSFALVQAGGDAPRLVRVGENIGGYTLRRVERDRAIFAGPDGKVQEYRVTKAGT